MPMHWIVIVKGNQGEGESVVAAARLPLGNHSSQEVSVWVLRCDVLAV
jgi:hypothetical protein